MTAHHDSSSDSLARASAGRVGVDGGSGQALGWTGAHDAAADPLSDVLRGVRLKGALYFHWDVAWPYVTPVPDGRTFASIILPGAQQAISYHVVTHGSAWGGLVGDAPVLLQTGDILLIPHGDAYVMSSSSEMCSGTGASFEESIAFFRQMAAGELPFVVEQGRGCLPRPVAA